MSYYVLVGIVGLLVLAFEIWLVKIDIKTIGSLRKRICQLEKQLRQLHSKYECTDNIHPTGFPSQSSQTEATDQSKSCF